MVYYFFRKYFCKQPEEEYERTSKNQLKAEGKCPVNVVGIPAEALENIFEISPELQRRLESIAAPRFQVRCLTKKY